MSNEKKETVFRDPQVNLYVKDVAASARFYGKLFGFVETFRTPETGPPDHVELRLGNFVLGFASISAAKKTHMFDVKEGPARGEIVLWTDNVDEAFEHLTEGGARILTPPHDFAGTLRAAWMMDPDGNNIQIVARQQKGKAER